VEPVLGTEIDAARRHEAQRAVDLAGDRLVAPTLARAQHELLVPRVHLREVGEPSFGEGPQQVECRDRLVVRGDEPLGIGAARLGIEGLVVDHVAPERVESYATDLLGVRGPRLRELSGDAADLDHGHAGRVRESDGHLQDDLQLVADRVG